MRVQYVRSVGPLLARGLASREGGMLESNLAALRRLRIGLGPRIFNIFQAYLKGEKQKLGGLEARVIEYFKKPIVESDFRTILSKFKQPGEPHPLVTMLVQEVEPGDLNVSFSPKILIRKLDPRGNKRYVAVMEVETVTQDAYYQPRMLDGA